MKYTGMKRLLLLILVFVVAFCSVLPQSSSLQVHAGTLTGAKDTLSNSRFSFRGHVGSGIASGGTTVTIAASSNPDNDLLNLFPRDVVCFADEGLNGCASNTSYTIATIPSQSGQTMALASALTTALDTSNIVISTQSAIHTVTFTTASAVNSGSVRVIIPAFTTSSTTTIDGFPDFGSSVSGSGFDLNGINGSPGTYITCAGGSVTWGTPTVTLPGSSGSGDHEVNCPFTGTLNSSTSVSITVGTSGKKVINPAPITSGHTRGTSDVYTITIRELDGSSNVIDTADVKVAPVEGVLVSATVDTSLTFSITGVDTTSTSTCGRTASASTGAASTSTTVPFHTITSSDTAYNMAQLLTVSTNSTSGYGVTVEENAALSIDGLGVTTIANTSCGATPCTSGGIADPTPRDWITYGTYRGFGYSLENVSGSDAKFQYSDSSRTFNAAPFYVTGASTGPPAVMSNGGSVSSSQVRVCYQIVVSGTQTAGYYLNKLTYIATPNF
ncbi:MAG: hypothetical protein RI947_192 [Candidatus Parcubacteria bacterium]|jgi:hypothetical protein